jgi:hypothetical protein
VWQDRSAVEDGYVVERSATGAAWTWVAVAHLPADTTAWTDPAPPPVRAIACEPSASYPRSGRPIPSKPSRRVRP